MQWTQVRPRPFCCCKNVVEYKELLSFDQSTEGEIAACWRNIASYDSQPRPPHRLASRTIVVWYAKSCSNRSGCLTLTTAAYTPKHCTHDIKSGTSRRLGCTPSPRPAAGISRAVLRRSSSILSRRSSAMSTNSPRWIFCTSLPGTGGSPSPSVNGAGTSLLEDALTLRRIFSVPR